MAGCTITPIAANKACSGKCKGGGGACHNAPRVWVVAACEAMISVFEKDIQGTLQPMPQNDQGVFPSLDQFQKFIDKADHAHELDQLVIVGGGNDIAWIHASLPPSAMRHIVAEIEYPLMASWFKEQGFSHLTNALENVFSG